METYAPCASCHRLNRISLGQGAKAPVCGVCKADTPMQALVVEVDAVGLQKLIRLEAFKAWLVQDSA